ncbi:MAG: hypothetical protein OXD50_04620 [Chloroflexi bacterium]|nr:hypothetical protein [Chloroflexota bacterium]
MAEKIKGTAQSTQIEAPFVRQSMRPGAPTKIAAPVYVKLDEQGNEIERQG